MLPCIIYMFIWTTIVYDPLACWTWNSSGWVFNMGGLDFAGGTPVHIASGCAALAYSYMLGKRSGHGTQELNYRPHNVTHIVIGTVFLWVGWFGFNAGSALSANLRAVMAAVCTNLAACVGGITWCLVDYRLERKWSTVGFCSGVIAGLVAITPGSGYVPAWSAVIFGICGGIACNYATKLKYFLRCDDALDIFAVHGVGGFIGNILTAFFAADYIAHLDGYTVIEGGWLNHHWIQLGYQLADSFAGGAYSFFGTCLILGALDFIGKFVPALRLRATEEEEALGIDDVEIGEFAVSCLKVLLPSTLILTQDYSTTTSSSPAKSRSPTTKRSTKACRHIRSTTTPPPWAPTTRRTKTRWTRQTSLPNGPTAHKLFDTLLFCSFKPLDTTCFFYLRMLGGPSLLS
jgi:Amt family ammonium transporter